MNDKTPAADAAVFDPAAAGFERVKAHNFGELVGPIWRRGDPLFGFTAADKHGNHIGIAHGGMLATFADQAMGMTAMRQTGKPHATISLNIEYVGAVHIGDFVEAHCEIVRITRSVIFMRSTLKVGDRIVATGSGVWKILKKE
jgi:uncharacterized protein (TIGR00369 family)